ncbi:hypothetical protein Lesp02_29870 [Lentzea sp. NBRC 105346]|uniref:NucA/NucB deoxyribonuclease domain-containing protein n=1 Tax=Lentzea sp. NBRC 105346 TaxID=3032205 RepID=UPI0024A39DC5|nr:NucA/NucB deoxyribonuclease domain-containing protein [Lentzea sp. NBRC 105346]GLZ30798.1 hypothetical protein Lesp02_29870 [Lentzea sp. NBRC 105346]
MARTKSGTGLFWPVVIVVGLMAVFGANTVIDTGKDLLGIGDEPASEYVTSPDGHGKTKTCTAAQVLNDRRCGDLKILVIDAKRMSFIGRNIQLAWGQGIPAVLTRNSAKQATNRAAACGSFVPKYGGSCDEYAFATTDEGGNGSRIEEVPLREQRCQGGAIAGGYSKAKIGQGDQFLVVISNPDKIAPTAFTGDDIAEDQAQCLV